MKVVSGEGMPMYRNPMEKGDLAVSFDIEFPPNDFLKEQLIVSSSISFHFISFLNLLFSHRQILHYLTNFSSIDILKRIIMKYKGIESNFLSSKVLYPYIVCFSFADDSVFYHQNINLPVCLFSSFTSTLMYSIFMDFMSLIALDYIKI